MKLNKILKLVALSLMLPQFALLAYADVSPAISANPATPVIGDAPAWDEFMDQQRELSKSQAPVVQNRMISLANRFQVTGLLGVSERKDFYNNYFITAAAQYHFTETHSWEFIRLVKANPSESPLASEIREQTSFRPDSQISRFQVGSSYIYTPVYGKYAWGSDSLVYFNVYGIVGAGARFATDQTQPYMELGAGMNHFIMSSHVSLVPEFRLRTYREQRTVATTVFESLFQVGAAWLF